MRVKEGFRAPAINAAEKETHIQAYQPESKPLVFSEKKRRSSGLGEFEVDAK